MDIRPSLNKDITIDDFREFYWLKMELIEFCRQEGLRKQGGKIEVADRVEAYLRTGKKETAIKKKRAPVSKFDWNHETLTLETVITDNYKNSKNVRTFFQEQIGSAFKFNVAFMNWMKENAGKTLADAVDEWNAIKAAKKMKKKRTIIAPQFEYNRYIRDFLDDNPDRTKADAIQFWKIKRSVRGDNVYKKSDLDLMV